MAEELAVFPLDVANEMLTVFRQLLASGLIDSANDDRDTPSKKQPMRVTNSQTPIYFRNDSTFTIPPYALMQMIDTVEVSGSQNYLKVKRPIDTTLLRCPLLINGPNEVEVDGYGVAQSGPVFRLLHNGTAYVAGDRLGPLTGTFTATYGGMYAVLGADDIETNIVRVMFDTSCMYGKTKSVSLVAGTPANVFVYDATGTLTSKEYLAETKGTAIPANTDLLLIPTFGRLFASRIC